MHCNKQVVCMLVAINMWAYQVLSRPKVEVGRIYKTKACTASKEHVQGMFVIKLPLRDY